MMDLEGLKAIFRDDRRWCGIGEVTKKEYAEDKSSLRVQLEMWPDKEEVVCRVLRTFLGYNKIKVGDLVAVIFPDGEEELGVVIGQFSTKEDPLPQQAVDEDLVLSAEEGQKSFLLSDTTIKLQKPDSDATEPLVLGLVLKNLLSSVLGELESLSDAVSTHTHIGNLGGQTSPPNPPEKAIIEQAKSLFASKKSSPVDDDGINSDLSFTEK